MGKLMAAAAVVAGLTGVVAAGTASATQAANAFYVAQNGSDGGGSNSNTCVNPKLPCATIQHALDEQAAINPWTSADPAPGNVINVAKGTITEGAVTCDAPAFPNSANNDVTIIGAKEKKVFIHITGVSANASLFDLSGCVGATVEDMEIINHGAPIVPVNGSGVLLCLNDTANSIHLLGGEPSGVVEACPNGTLSNSVLEPTLCSTLSKPGPDITGSLAEGFNLPASLRVKKIPACAPGDTGFVTINGNEFAYAVSASKNTIVLTALISGVSGVAVASGTAVEFGSSVAAYTQTGDVCVGPNSTNCIVENNIITGGGAALNAPIGILVSDSATATVTDNTVTGNTDVNGKGIGIAVVPYTDGDNAGNTTIGITESLVPTGSGNSVSGNDTGIEAAFNPAGGFGASAVTINGNTVSGIDSGVIIANSGVNPTDNVAQFEANTVSGTSSGPGLTLAGDTGLTIGGISSTFGNSIDGNGVGVVFAPGPALTGGSLGNTLEHNDVSNNLAIGVELSGCSTPEEFGGPFPGPAGPANCAGAPGGSGSQPNLLTANTWSGNGTTSQAFGANVLDSANDAVNPIAAPLLTLSADVPAGSNPTSFTITTNSVSNYTIPMGTILNLQGPTNPLCKEGPAAPGCDFGNPTSPNTSNFYVMANTVIAPGLVGTSVPVTDLVASLDTPFTVINTGTAIAQSKLASAASTNVYTLDTCKPDIGGSATLNAGSSTPVGGYYAC